MEIKCWICKDIANSAEHKFKASDIKRHFGKKFGNGNPIIYKSGDIEANLDNYKSKELKFEKIICTKCNNIRTKPHDDAYDKFADYIGNNESSIFDSKQLDFKNIYGENWNEGKLNLYKYYSKHAGCKIVTNATSYEINNLSEFILGNENLNTLTLQFQFKEGMKYLNDYFLGNFANLYNGGLVIFGKRDKNLNFASWCSYQAISVNWVVSKEIEKINLPDFNSQIEPVEILYFQDCPDIGEGSDDILERIEQHRFLNIEDQVDYFKKLLRESD